VRLPIFAANWKMHKTVSEALDFVERFLPLVRGATGVEVILAPPFTALDAVARRIAGSPVLLAAQNVHAEPKGAFTGEISVPMLADLGCRYAIIGHSERRSLFGETDEAVARKAQALLAREIRPIVCIGETLAEREAGQTFGVLERQLAGSLAGVPAARAEEVVIAYEPVWAIGTGRTATPEVAQEAHAFVRDRLVKQLGAVSKNMRILYGGSVKPENAGTLMGMPDIDGALVGGASLDPKDFSRIVRYQSEGDRG
jgi:triosephosphate isomerase